MTIVLDGRRLARERRPGLAARAARVTDARGHAPRVALIAFAGDDGRARHSERKAQACAAVGVDAIPTVLPGHASTASIRRAIDRTVQKDAPDAVFVEFPFPEGVDGDAVAAAIPEALDLDVMSPARVRSYFSDPEAEPPLTVSAGLVLLDRYGVDLAGLPGILVADPSPFASMFVEALARRGACLAAIVSPDASDLPRLARDARLVVSAAARPGLLRSGRLAAGAVVLDVGYFNPGGRGDVDLADGIDHLGAIMPVPGGIGPMTISVLVERVVAMAERAAGSRRPAATAEGVKTIL